VPPGEYDGYVTSKQKLCTLDAKSTYCNCMTEMHTAGIWDPILDNYLVTIVTDAVVHLFCAVCCRLLPSPSQPVADREDNRRTPSQVIVYVLLHISNMHQLEYYYIGILLLLHFLW